MKERGSYFFLLCLCSLVLLTISGCASRSEFTPLFNGKNLDNWTEKQGAIGVWSVQDGVMYATGGDTGWIQPPKKYKNFVLTCEWKMPEGGDSGVIMGITDDSYDPSWDGIQIQIRDDSCPAFINQPPSKVSGSIYAILPPTKQMNKGVNEWNKFVVTRKDTRIKVEFNGETVIDVDTRDYREPFLWGPNIMPSLYDRPTEGYIGLQSHGTDVWFRNVSIKELK